MEANEAQELAEQQEKALESNLKPVSFSMAVLAVLVAIVTVMGHRTHTEAVLLQAKASDQWNLYQAKKIRQNDTELATDLLSALELRDPAAGTKLADGYNAHEQKWTEDLKEEQAEAEGLQAEVKVAEHRADAFFTCGSNRLLMLMKRIGKQRGVPGQVAMEQVMACGLGPCYVCVRTFEVNGKKELRRVCIEGPVFDMQEAVGW